MAKENQIYLTRIDKDADARLSELAEMLSELKSTDLNPVTINEKQAASMAIRVYHAHCVKRLQARKDKQVTQ